MSEYTKEDFLKLSLNQLSKQGENPYTFYRTLINSLHNNGIILQSDETAEGEQSPSDVLKNIFNNIDWDLINGHTNGEDKFFNGEQGLYTSLCNALNQMFNVTGNDYKRKDLVGGDSQWWTNNYWNESVAKLLQIFAQRIDPDNIETYEKSGLLIELTEPADTIDKTHLRAGLSARGAAAELRIIDIIGANAGNSFEGENETYWYGSYYDFAKLNFNYITYAGEEKFGSIIYSNILFNQKADSILGAIADAQSISIKDLRKMITLDYSYSGYIDHSDFSDAREDQSVIVNMSTEGEQYRFKIVKQPWVIPWYNFDGETYSKVRGTDKKISALTNSSKLNLTHTTKYIKLIMPQYKRKVEVEDLNRNFWVIAQVIAGISADLFDEDGPIGSVINGLIKEIGQLWENLVYLWSAMALLSQNKFYTNTHCEIVELPKEAFLPYKKFDDFEMDDITEEQVKEKLSYLVEKYPNDNLIIMPLIKSNCYEHNYFSKLSAAGIYVYNRNRPDNQWSVYDYSFLSNIDADSFADYIYGVSESDDVYTYLAPLSDIKTQKLDTLTRFYGLMRYNVDMVGELYKYNEETEKWEENIDVFFNFKVYDTTKQIIGNEENNLIYYVNGGVRKEDMNIGIFEGVRKDIRDEEIESVSLSTTKINKGYYQGELLSCYANSKQ